MKIKFLLPLLAGCLLFMTPLSLCAQEPVCGKCLKKKSNCPYRCNHPTCKTCGKVCGAKNNPCPYGGKHPKCNACGKLKENCAYKGKHPTCSTCGRICGASSNACPYGGKHPTCSSCGKVCGAMSNSCPYNGKHSTHAGHEWVDLGLSVKWATCNVGASSPTGYGNYYAWGETSPKSNYDTNNCKTYEHSLGDIGGNSSYDAARANWGGSWRMPTKAEFDELINNCTLQWTTQNGVAGTCFTSQKNGNSIFLPATGYRLFTETHFAGESGKYWSSTPSMSSTPRNSEEMHCSSGGASTIWDPRYTGHTVRPVLE